MGSLFRRQKEFHKDIQLKSESPVQLGEKLIAQILVGAGNKGVRVESLKCSLVLADITVTEEIIDGPMGLTASLEVPTVIWELTRPSL